MSDFSFRELGPRELAFNRAAFFTFGASTIGAAFAMWAYLGLVVKPPFGHVFVYLTSTYAVSSLILGLIVLPTWKERGAVSGAKVAAALAGLAVLLAALFTAAETWLNGDIGRFHPFGQYLDVSFGVDGAFGLFLLSLASSLFYVFALFVVGFAQIWLMSQLKRHLAPRTLRIISKISEKEKKQREEGAGGRGGGKKGKVYVGMYCVPTYLDTTRIRLERGRLDRETRWKYYGEAVAFQINIGVWLGFFMAFNPVLLDYTDIYALTITAVLMFLFVPVFGLAGYGFRRLRVGIEGTSGYFPLETGCKLRLSNTLPGPAFALICLYFARKMVSWPDLGMSFFLFLAGLIAICALFTFIYFNWFEPRVLARVVEEYELMVEEGRTESPGQKARPAGSPGKRDRSRGS